MLRKETITAERLKERGWKYDDVLNAWTLNGAEIVKSGKRWRLKKLGFIISGLCSLDEIDLIFEKMKKLENGPSLTLAMKTLRREVAHRKLKALYKKPMAKPRPIAEFLSAKEGAKR